jgi:hypothetical protein
VPHRAQHADQRQHQDPNGLRLAGGVAAGVGVKEGATGTGLGLSIARDLALRMGGELRWRPSDIGAVFELWIPIGYPAEAAT